MFGDIIHKQDFRTLGRNAIPVMRRNTALWRHKRWIGENDIEIIIPFLQAGQRVIFADIRRCKAVQIHVDTGKPHHVWRNIIARKIFCHPGHVIRHQRGFSMLVQIALFDVIIGADQEPCRSAGRIKDGFIFCGSRDLHHHVDDMAGRTELACVALAAHNGKQVFKGITQIFAVLVGEFRNFL